MLSTGKSRNRSLRRGTRTGEGLARLSDPNYGHTVSPLSMDAGENSLFHSLSVSDRLITESPVVSLFRNGLRDHYLDLKTILSVAAGRPPVWHIERHQNVPRRELCFD